VLFDIRDDDPDKPPTVEMEVLSPEIFIFSSDYIISVKFSPIQI
jgi:hypothetical protein